MKASIFNEFLFYNTSIFDEELYPEVAAILKEPAFPPIEGNAYFASLGLKEIQGNDITQTGYKLTQKHIENSKNNRVGLTDNQYNEVFGKNSNLDLFWDVPIITCDMVYTYDCLSKDFDGFYEQGFNSQLNNPRLQLLLERYQEIIQMQTYQAYIGDMHLFQYLPYSKLRKLGEIQIINQYKNYSTTEFIDQLYKDMKFWKMLLTNRNLLIDKMVALSSVRRDVLHLSEFIRKTTDIQDHEVIMINKILQPLQSRDMDLIDAFEIEAKFIFRNNYLIEKNSSFIENILFQPNATNNYFYKNDLMSLKQFRKMPLKDVFEIQQPKIQKEDTWKLPFHYLYNLMGKKLTEYARCKCEVYIGRAYDTANMVKLVNIQLQIKLTKDDSIINIISKPENLNPYTDKPFVYNSQERVLEFDCLDDFQECKVRI